MQDQSDLAEAADLTVGAGSVRFEAVLVPVVLDMVLDIRSDYRLDILLDQRRLDVPDTFDYTNLDFYF